MRTVSFVTSMMSNSPTVCAGLLDAGLFLAFDHATLAKLRPAASALTQIVQLCAARVRFADDLNLFNAWRAGKEGTLDANAVRCRPAHGKGCIVATAPDRDHCTGEDLHTLTVAFYNARMNAHIVTGRHGGDVGVVLRVVVFNRSNQFVIHIKSALAAQQLMSLPGCACLLSINSSRHGRDR